MASAFKLRRTSRDEGQSERDERVRTENIKAGRGYSTAEHKPKSKGAAREEMSGKSDAPAKKKSKPKPKSASPFKLTPKDAPIPTPKPTQFDPALAASPPRPDNFNQPAGDFTPPVQFPPDLAASPPRPDNFNQPAGNFTPPTQILDQQGFAGQETAPYPVPTGPMAGQQTAPRPPLPNPFAQLGGPGGPATSPFTGGPTGPAASVDQRGMIARLLGLGG